MKDKTVADAAKQLHALICLHQPDFSADTAWSFRLLDQQAGHSKGHAFRAFKASCPHWQENQDFHCFTRASWQSLLDQAQTKALIYPMTQNMVIISRPGRVQELLHHLTI